MDRERDRRPPTFQCSHAICLHGLAALGQLFGDPFLDQCSELPDLVGLKWGRTVVDSVVNKCCISVRKCFVSVHKCS